MLVAVAIVINSFRVTVPIGGAPVLTVSFGGPLIKFAGLLFGPMFGGAAGVVVDLVVHFINPMGAYIWELTVVEFIKGASIAILFQVIQKVRFKVFSICYICVCTAAVLFGLVNAIVMNTLPESAYCLMLMSIGRRADYVSYGLAAAGLLGLTPYLLAWIWLRKREARDDGFFKTFMRLLPAVGIPCFILTTVNTFVLRRYGIFTSVPFVAIWIPRMVEELIMVLLNVYMLAALFKIYSIAFKRRG